MRGRSMIMGWLSRNRNALAVVLTLVVGVVGFVALHRLLREVRPSDVRHAFSTLTRYQLMLSVALTVASYLALTLYDVIALRVVGRSLPFRTAALASFTSYTLSHNLGLSLLTGGSARMRIYTSAGLTPADVAHVILNAGVGFWSGVLVLSGVALGIHAGPLTVASVVLPENLQRVAALAIVGVEALFIIFADRYQGSVRLFRWTLPLPSAGQAIAQIGVSIADLAAASAALFVLVPSATAAGFPTFFLAYALAIVAALVTHVPAGLGVFEAVMVAALPGFDPAALFAALILYRVIYYLLPLALSALLFALHEGAQWRLPLGTLVGNLRSVARGVAPTMIAALVFLGGIVLLISGALPAVPDRMRVLHAVLPMPFLETSHVAGSLTGTALLLLAPGLYRRLDGAFWATRALLLAGAGFSIVKGLDYEEAFVMLTIAAVLQWTRPAFYRRTRLTADALSPGWLLAIATGVGLSIWIGLFAYKHVSYDDGLWWIFAQHANASRFLRASFAVAVMLVAALIWRFMRPTNPDVEVVDVSKLGGALLQAERTDAFLALNGDKRFLVSPSGNAFLMYQVRKHSWIVMGDPVGRQSERPDLLWRLRELADAAQGRLLLYEVSADLLPIAIDLGLQLVKYGEEARVELSRFTLEGSAARPLRHAVRRAVRDGATFEIVSAADLPAIFDELRAISNAWLKAKDQKEKGFSVGRFDPSTLAHFDCAVVRADGKIVAFANILATANKNELSVDLMRHADEMPTGTMELLFASLMEWGYYHRYRWFSLGMAPLAGLERRRLAPIWSRAGAFLYHHGQSLYGFKGLRTYKTKFGPIWEPRYIAGPHGLGMARALFDLQALIASGSTTSRLGTPRSAKS